VVRCYAAGTRKRRLCASCSSVQSTQYVTHILVVIVGHSKRHCKAEFVASRSDRWTSGVNNAHVNWCTDCWRGTQDVLHGRSQSHTHRCIQRNLTMRRCCARASGWTQRCVGLQHSGRARHDSRQSLSQTQNTTLLWPTIISIGAHRHHLQ
jgi:hypothetical protein